MDRLEWSDAACTVSPLARHSGAERLACLADGREVRCRCTCRDTSGTGHTLLSSCFVTHGAVVARPRAPVKCICSWSRRC